MSVIESIETFRRGDALSMVRVTTDDGAIGWGQTSTYLAAYSASYLHEYLAPRFLGTDPFAAPSVIDLCERDLYKIGGTVFLRALCGIDTAILDLLATRAGVPVYRYLGGPTLSEIPVYGSSMRRDIAPEAEADRLVGLRETHGYGAFKIRIGAPMSRDRDIAAGRTEAIIRTVRDRVGDDVELLADANGSFTAARAIQVGRLLEDEGYFHFEEPCPYEELEQTAAVAAALDIRVAGGEQDTSIPMFRRMIANGVVDIVQPDVGYIGGVRRALSVAQLAQASGIPCTPHAANHSLVQVFTAHLFAAAPAATHFLEWSIESGPWESGLYSGEPVVEGGVIRLGENPGWGIEIDPTFIAQADYLVSRV